jgi:hypothetical protein
LFPFYLFLQTGLSISPRCYCDLLVNCTKHFFLKSVLCSSTKMSHWQHFYISMGLHKGSLEFLSSSSNSQPNLLQQVVSLKRDCKGDRLLFVCLLFHQQCHYYCNHTYSISLLTGTLGSILVELHKMIGMFHASDSSFLCQHVVLILTELRESSCQPMNIVARK